MEERAVQHHRRFSATRNPEAWLRTVAVNLSLSSWSDAHGNKRSKHPYGPYESNGRDLDDLQLTGHDLPGRLDDRPTEVFLPAMTADGSTLFLTGSDARMWSSDDGGDSWTSTPDR